MQKFLSSNSTGRGYNGFSKTIVLLLTEVTASAVKDGVQHKQSLCTTDGLMSEAQWIFQRFLLILKSLIQSEICCNVKRWCLGTLWHFSLQFVHRYFSCVCMCVCFFRPVRWPFCLFCYNVLEDRTGNYIGYDVGKSNIPSSVREKLYSQVLNWLFIHVYVKMATANPI